MAASTNDSSPLLSDINGDDFRPESKLLGKFGVALEHNVTRKLQIRGNFLSRNPNDVENDVVVIFVVAFDTKSGNIVEWCLPDDNDLDGVEFKSMPSGAHTTVSDFTYFKMDNLYGLSCFAKMSVDSEAERGARMKSVGLLSTSYTNLYRHMPFLESQVRQQLETPGKYEGLEAFFHDHKSLLPATFNDGPHQRRASEADSGVSVISSPKSDHVLPHMRITHPAGCFGQFINFFGENIFTLWKYVLLRRRVLFFSPPPIGVVCFRVYCACTLGQYEVELETSPELKPYFYINIADIDSVESEVSYVACKYHFMLPLYGI
ncbi:hypothetical protein BSL78_27081 [Apostichopus japonicus]|uniref:DENN domain-containing protein 11 n=1 Tax=Stichopus japonicus TaxID=307972 RepID=A0A2G8JK27_STIJA|nr:hypothetical protein BSL78_27081 [Apostichopus japonicus]